MGKPYSKQKFEITLKIYNAHILEKLSARRLLRLALIYSLIPSFEFEPNCENNPGYSSLELPSAYGQPAASRRLRQWRNDSADNGGLLVNVIITMGCVREREVRKATMCSLVAMETK